MSTWLLGSSGAGAAATVLDTSAALLLLLFGALAFLAKSVADLRREVAVLREAPGPAAARPSPSAHHGDVSDIVSPEIKAAIFASVFVALDHAPTRVLRITASPLPANWSLEGRRDVCGSHRVRQFFQR